MYKESVEELISEIFLDKTRGYEAKFHGAGREDIDVKMLGTGRPFVLEIKEPKIRKLDLQKLAKEVNEHSKGKTEYDSKPPRFGPGGVSRGQLSLIEFGS